MTYIIPNQQTKAIRQINSTDLLGELHTTKNIDLSEKGYIKLSHPAVATLTTDTDANFNYADAMMQSKDGQVFVNSANVFSGSVDLSPLSNRASDTNDPTPSFEEDCVFFNGTEVISSGSSIYYRSASTTWTSVSLSLDTSYPTQMDMFDNFNSVLVGNKNTVKRINTSWTVDLTLTLPAEYDVTSIASNNNYVAIGTRHNGGGEGKMFIWDGTSTAYNGSFGIGAQEVLTVKKYQSSFALVTSAGQLLQFNGGGFSSLANLPAYYFNSNWIESANDHSVLSNRGMVVDNDDIYIRLDSSMYNRNIDFNPNFQGGVWKYIPSSGLHCVYTPSFTKVGLETITTSNVNTTTDVITVASAPVTGTPVIYKNFGGTVLGGIKIYTVYYVIKLTSTTIQLATSQSNALSSIYIDLTGTGNDNQQLSYFYMNDYGWTYANFRGSIAVLGSLTIGGGYINDKIVFTAELFGKQATTRKTVFNTLIPMLPNIGYFTTVKMQSSKTTDDFGQFSIKYRPLGDGEKIIIKSKTQRRRGLPFGSIKRGTITSGTWTDTNTFTTTVDMSLAEEGDEIEIVAGVGAGWMAQISSIEESSGTYTITLDDDFIFASANDIMYFFVDNWEKVKEITSENDSIDYDSFTIDKSGKDIQLKVVLCGVEVTVEELKLQNNEHEV